MLEEMNISSNSWSLLQQPAHPGNGMNASFRALLAAIDQGWQVEEPVQILSSTQNPFRNYCFVLAHPTLGQVYHILVPAVREVERFVGWNNYQIVSSDDRRRL